jgi:hypothetical protein
MMRSSSTTAFGLLLILGPGSAWAQEATSTATIATTATVTAPAPIVEPPVVAVPAAAPAEPPPAPVAEPAPGSEPRPVPEPVADATTEKKGGKEPQKTTLVRNIAEAGSNASRPWFISGAIELRMLAISDEDPENGRQMFYGLRAGYSLLPGLTVQAALGLSQDFVAEEGESGFRFTDLQLLGNYNWTLPIEAPWFHRDLALTHRAGFYLPTSRRSQDNDVYLVPELLNRARIDLIDRLYLGADLIMRYQIPQYAEGAGIGAPTLTQFLFAGTLALEYNVLESERYGYVTFGVDASSIYRVRYKALDSTDQQRWKQAINWSLYGVYAPYAFLAFTAVVTSGDDVLRADGVETPFFGSRETVRLIFNLTGRY